ncbi:MAG: galactokinase [Phycisphaerae bacterium]
MNPSACREAFAARYGRDCESLARAPGRVNLIGEHVDYNDGFVLPIAIAQSTWCACAARLDETARVYSATIDDEQSWPLDQPPRDSRSHVGSAALLPACDDAGASEADDRARHSHWTHYVAGVAELLRRRGARLHGFDMLIAGDVPVGAGLASSAALEVAAALALAYQAGEPLEAREMIDLCRQAEHEFAGVPCGIMDQSASLLAKEDCALLLDCRTRQVRHIPFPAADACVAVVDSGVRHELAAGEYARRLAQCQAGVAHFQRISPQIRALRDVSPEMVRSQAFELDPVVAARCLHVTSEIARAKEAAEALRTGRWAELGALLNDSHRSLRDDYEVSCPELDRLVELLVSTPGVFGARMTGAGFGGSVVALARPAALEIIESRVRNASKGQANPPRCFATRPGAGATVVG